jgi:perosamine synthetase
MRNQGRDEDGTWLRHIQLGFNYRLDELSAALGFAQLQRLAELQRGRARVAATYDRLFAAVQSVIVPTPAPGAVVDWFVYVIRVAEGIDRDRLMRKMVERGVPSRPYFSPIHLQPFYLDSFGWSEGDFPITERVASTTLAIPFSSRMTVDDAAYVVEMIAQCLREQEQA